MNFIVFFFILALYVVGCVFVGARLSKCLPTRTSRRIFRIMVGVMSTLFFVQRIVSAAVPEYVNRILYVVSTMWLVVVMHLVIVLFIFAIARFIARKRNGNVPPANMHTFWNSWLIVGIILFCGIINAYTPKLTHYTLHNDNILQGDTVRIALVSDLHMGYAVRSGDMERLATMVNAHDVDFCLIAGDLFDGDVRPVIGGDLGAPLRKMKTHRGTFAVLGNHEYMGDADIAADYIRSLGITLLRDSAVAVSTTSFNMKPFIWFIGRDDMTINKFGKEQACKDIAELNNDTCQFKVVIDHQPGRFDDSERIGANLHVSGHTHAGQVWPMRIFTKMIYELDYGYMSKGSTDFIVTSGFGTWGPRFRTGNTPEVVIIDITH